MTTHFAYITCGHGDDTRLAFVRPSVFKGKVLCRSVVKGRRTEVRVSLRSPDAIVRAATNTDRDEVEVLAALLIERGMERTLVEGALPR